MRDLWISLNEKYQKNKTIIWSIIIVVVLFLLVMRNLDKALKSEGGSGNETATSESVYYGTSSVKNTIKNVASTSNDDYSSINETIENTQMDSSDYITLFIELCNNKKFESAYDMLSEDCKSVLYPTKQEFLNKYANVIFKTYKNYNIELYKKPTYKVTYKEDVITTGGISDSVTPEYITITSDNKLNISNFIKREETSIKAHNLYMNAEITAKTVYADYEVYQIKVKNIIKADIYLNNTLNNGIYVKDANNKKYYVATENYIDEDYLVPAESTKVINLKVNKPYNTETKLSAMNFDNIKILNKAYYSSDTNNLKMTNYPENTKFEISFI